MRLMPKAPPPIRSAAALAIALFAAPPAKLTAQVPSPTEFFGFPMGAETKLANWDDLTAYYETLARTSDRVALDTLGPTTMGRPFVMLTITAPANPASAAPKAKVARSISRVLIPSELDMARFAMTARTIRPTRLR